MTDYKAFIRLCRRTKKCLETERGHILNGNFENIGPVLEEKEILISQVMTIAEELLEVPSPVGGKVQSMAATSLREVIQAAEENSIVLSGALRGLKIGRSRQTQKQENLVAYTASGDHGQAAPMPKSSEAIA